MRRSRHQLVEIAAARLTAAYHDCNDTDDDLSDPLVREIIDHTLGHIELGDLSDAGRATLDLFHEMIHGERQFYSGQEWTP